MIKHNFNTIILYILLFAGGLWNQLGLFTIVMPKLSSSFIISISIFSIFLAFKTFKYQNKKLSYITFLFVFITSIFIEYIGVRTSFLFGHYKYLSTIQPQINNVPIAIGFAWISTMLSSIGILIFIFNKLNKFLKVNTFFIMIYTKLNSKSTFTKFIFKFIFAILNGLLMTFFDYIMEPAAIKLNYWNWFDINIPFYNYFCWFIFGTFFTLIFIININLNELFIENVIDRKNSQLHHIYISQCLYFVMVIF